MSSVPKHKPRELIRSQPLRDPNGRFTHRTILLEGLERDSVISENIKYAEGIAYFYYVKWGRFIGVKLDDMKQDALEGLVIASNKFDKTRDVLFRTYATWWIKQCVVRELAFTNPKRVGGRDSFIRYKALSQAIDAYEGKADPSQLKVMASRKYESMKTEKGRERAIALKKKKDEEREHLSSIFSLSKQIGDSDSTMEDVVGKEETISSEVELALLIEKLVGMFDSLTDKGRKVIEQLYFPARGEVNTVDIANEWEMTPANVAELRATSLRRLRRSAIRAGYSRQDFV